MRCLASCRSHDFCLTNHSVTVWHLPIKLQNTSFSNTVTEILYLDFAGLDKLYSSIPKVSSVKDVTVH